MRFWHFCCSLKQNNFLTIFGNFISQRSLDYLFVLFYWLWFKTKQYSLYFVPYFSYIYITPVTNLPVSANILNWTCYFSRKVWESALYFNNCFFFKYFIRYLDILAVSIREQQYILHWKFYFPEKFGNQDYILIVLTFYEIFWHFSCQFKTTT